MINQVIYTPLFIKRAKHLKKKHPSLLDDLQELVDGLIVNPKQGVDLGGGLFKIRLAIKSKNKGKSGGYRIITYLVNSSNDEIFINMITLFDKSEENSISKQYLLNLLKDLF